MFTRNRSQAQIPIAANAQGALRAHKSFPKRPRTRPQVEFLEDRVLLSVLYDEAASGDMSNDQSAPTPLTLVAGTNSVKGVVVGSNDFQDWVRIRVPAGMNLSAVVLATYVSDDAQGFSGLQRGSSFVGSPFSAGSYLGYAHFGTGATNPSVPTNLVGADLLPIMADKESAAQGSEGFTPPLGAGDYTFLFQQLGASTAYQFDFVATSAAAATTTTLTAQPAATTGGQLVTFTATVAPSPGAAGTVNFLDNGAAIPGGSNVALSGGVAVFSTSSLSVGTHPVTAAYSGAAGFSASASAAQNVVINPAAAGPQVTNVVLNGGLASVIDAPHSRLVNVQISFDQAVELDANAIALTLHTNGVTFGGTAQPSGLGAIPALVVASSADKKSWTVTFSGQNTESGADGLASLKDGVYDFKVLAAKVHPQGAPNVNMAADFPLTVHRLFGDLDHPETPGGGTANVDFSAIVNTGDNIAFRTAFNRLGPDYKAYFDFDGSGLINTGDNLEFRNRFNRMLVWRA